MIALRARRLSFVYLIDFDRTFAAELEDLCEFETLGLVMDEDGWLTVTPRGRFVIRSIAMVFDRYLRRDREARRYSGVINLSLPPAPYRFPPP